MNVVTQQRCSRMWTHYQTKSRSKCRTTEVSLNHNARPMTILRITKRHASGTQEVQGDSRNADRERRQMELVWPIVNPVRRLRIVEVRRRSNHSSHTNHSTGRVGWWNARTGSLLQLCGVVVVDHSVRLMCNGANSATLSTRVCRWRRWRWWSKHIWCTRNK